MTTTAQRLPTKLPDLPSVREEFHDQIYTHVSCTSTTKPVSYERLAFLGNAHLNAAITRVLFEHLKKYTLGDMSEIRSKYNSNANVAGWGQAYGFDEKLVIAPHLLPLTEPSRFVAGSFQAYLGAVLLSSSQDEVNSFVEALIVPTLDEFRDLPKEPDRTVVQTLHERLVLLDVLLPEYEFSELETRDPKKRFEAECVVRGNVVAKGVGKNKDEAKRRSAENAMRMTDRQFKMLKDLKEIQN
jgi:dsRNA-specific ribonuclease